MLRSPEALRLEAEWRIDRVSREAERLRAAPPLRSRMAALLRRLAQRPEPRVAADAPSVQRD